MASVRELCLLAACCALPLQAVCPCQKQLSVCNEVAAEGSIVFVGAVKSITPKALGYWNPARRGLWDGLNAAYDRLSANPSPPALLEWKDSIGRLFPDLPEKLRQELNVARTQAALLRVFNEVMGGGTQVRFQVETVFRGDDDDDDKDDDKVSPKKEFSVWTPFGDCGIDFQVGERYLVYAVSDEGTDDVETNRCMRTRRLSDAGRDLAYMYYYKNHPKASGRLEGVVTSDPRYQPEYGAPLEQTKTSAPMAGVVIELQSAAGTRYATSDPDGWFVFDGLAAGEYKVAAYARGFPERVKLLAPPGAVYMKDRGCVNQIVLIPRAGP
jgi:Carboxypeptidase regulatory-like domain